MFAPCPKEQLILPYHSLRHTGWGSIYIVPSVPLVHPSLLSHLSVVISRQCTESKYQRSKNSQTAHACDDQASLDRMKAPFSIQCSTKSIIQARVAAAHYEGCHVSLPPIIESFPASLQTPLISITSRTLHPMPPETWLVQERTMSAIMYLQSL
jgi:hypothetical protein